MILRHFFVTALITVGLPFTVVACGDDDGGGNDDTDTTVGTDTGGGADTGGGTNQDTGGTEDTLYMNPDVPDIPTPAGSVVALQIEAEKNGCLPAGFVDVNPAVSLTGVVVASPKYDAFTPDTGDEGALDGYYVQDAAGGPWAGINVVFNRADATNFLPGTVLDLQGELEEFFCFTQLKVTNVVEGAAGAAPAPREIAASEAPQEENESTLITIKGVTVEEELPGGRYRVTGGIIVDHDFDFFLSMDATKTYDITGIVKWAFDEWRLMPRSEGDLVPQGGGTETTITGIQSGTDSVGCTASEIGNFGQDLDVTGVITVPKFRVTDSLDGYYVSDGTQDPYSGIAVAIGSNQATNFAVGDMVSINGGHIEFYCMSQLSADRMSSTGAGTAPEPVAIDNNLSDADLEQWEGVVVTLSNLNVTGVTDFGEAETDAGVMIDNGIMDDAFTAPAMGTSIVSVTGAIRYSFSSYRISPRTAADIVTE